VEYIPVLFGRGFQDKNRRKSTLTGCAPVVETAKIVRPIRGRLVNGPSSSTQARTKETCEPPGELHFADASQMSDVDPDELLTRIKFKTAVMW
jgi:hypothetical protein